MSAPKSTKPGPSRTGPGSATRPGAAQPGQGTKEAGFTPGRLAPHLLVIEDDPVIREEIVALLETEGYLVTGVGTGEEALRTMRGITAQLALVDLMLPDADGIDLLVALTEIDPKLRGIVLTGHATIDHAVRAIRSGAAEFLTKPFQPEVVLLTVKRQLEMQSLKQENALLKKTVLKSGGVTVRDFEPDELDPRSPGAPGRGKSEYDRGLADGERRAQATLAAQRAKEHALMTTALRELERHAKSLAERMEAQSAALAFEIATKIVHEAAEEKRDLVALRVRDALGRIKDQWQHGGLVTIKAHPQDVPLLEQVRDQLAGEGEGPAGLRIEPDPTVSAGGCRVETATRVVDATLEAQLQRLGEALKRRSGHDAR